MAASALLGDLSWNLLETAMADSGENPHVFMRYETVKDCSLEVAVVKMNLTDNNNE